MNNALRRPALLAFAAAAAVAQLLVSLGCAPGPRSRPLDPVTLQPAADTAASSASDAATPADAPQHAAALPAYSVATALPMPWGSLAARAAAADVVIIAERHDDTNGQRHAAELFEEIIDRAPGQPALALEFLERDAQDLADDFATGLVSRQGFAAALALKNRGSDVARRDMLGRNPVSTAGMPLLDPHLDMAAAARDAGLPLIAANAPRRYVGLIRAKGPAAADDMTHEQRRLFVLPDQLTEGPYRDRFYGLMAHMTSSHGAADTGKAAADVDALYLAQNVWDATMAESVLNALNAGHEPVVLVVGQFHTDFQGGLLDRIRRAAPAANIMTISYEPTFSPRLRDEDAGRADVVVYSGSPAPTEGE